MSAKFKFQPLKVELNAPLAVVPGHFIRTDDAVEYPIALLWEGGGTHGKPQQIAYAYLFAAASEMYELLELLKEQHFNSFEPDNQSRTYKKICAVIAKAKGSK